jgi:hypothetical protein
MTPAMNVGVCDQCGLPTARISSLCRAVARSASASAFAARRSARMIADAAPLAVSGCAEAIAMRSESGSSMNASRIRARFFGVGSVASRMLVMTPNVRAKPRAAARRLARAAHDMHTVPRGPGAVPLRVGA